MNTLKHQPRGFFDLPSNHTLTTLLHHLCPLRWLISISKQSISFSNRLYPARWNFINAYINEGDSMTNCALHVTFQRSHTAKYDDEDTAEQTQSGAATWAC